MAESFDQSLKRLIENRASGALAHYFVYELMAFNI